MNKLTQLAVSLSLVGLTYALPLTAVAAINEHTPTKVATDAKQKASFLFVLRADTGVISKTDGNYLDPNQSSLPDESKDK